MPQSKSVRALAAVLSMAAVLAARDLAAAPASSLCAGGPLEVLLTNDDGFESPGIRALYAGLRAAGHRVLLAAPAANASGSSTSFTWGPVRVTRDAADPQVFGVAGSPATSVVLAATALYPEGRRPDLVISGINDGTNTGSILVISGTIGAALAGTTLLDPPVPGIAVNAARATTGDAGQSLPPTHLDQVAAHFVRLVGDARGWFCEHGRVTRASTVLNVNYPARPVAGIAGVRVAAQGHTTDLRLDFEPTGDGVYDSKRATAPTAGSERDSDTALLEAGYVTVTPLSARLAERDLPLRALERRLAR